jgi:hypothetical protein
MKTFFLKKTLKPNNVVKSFACEKKFKKSKFLS